MGGSGWQGATGRWLNDLGDRVGGYDSAGLSADPLPENAAASTNSHKLFWRLA